MYVCAWNTVLLVALFAAILNRQHSVCIYCRSISLLSEDVQVVDGGVKVGGENREVSCADLPSTITGYEDAGGWTLPDPNDTSKVTDHLMLLLPNSTDKCNFIYGDACITESTTQTVGTPHEYNCRSETCSSARPYTVNP